MAGKASKAATASNPFDPAEEANGALPQETPLKEKTLSAQECQQALFELQSEIVNAGQQLESAASAYYILCDLVSGRDTPNLPRAVTSALSRIMGAAMLDGNETVQALSLEYVAILRQLQVLVNRANDMVDVLSSLSGEQTPPVVGVSEGKVS